MPTHSPSPPKSQKRPPSARVSVFLAGVFLCSAGYLLAPAGALQGGADTTHPPPSTQTFAPPAASNADSNNRMIAVTGVDLTGSAILYLIDTINPHIAVYQASGGSKGTQSIKLVAARRIDLDLQLDGFNDKSEFSYKDLASRFAKLEND